MWMNSTNWYNFGRFHWANTIHVCKFLYNATSFGAHVHIFMTGCFKLYKQNESKHKKINNSILCVLIISRVNECLLCEKLILFSKEIVRTHSVFFSAILINWFYSQAYTLLHIQKKTQTFNWTPNKHKKLHRFNIQRICNFKGVQLKA